MEVVSPESAKDNFSLSQLSQCFLNLELAHDDFINSNVPLYHMFDPKY